MERRDSRQATSDYPHPFIHKLKLTRAQRIRGIVLGTILFPIRIFLVALCFLMMWPIARLRWAGLSEEERSRPVVAGWRWWLLHSIIRFLSRAAFFFLGFWVRVKGRRAGRKEAPVLAVAPHSSFLDMLVLPETQLATVVSRSENQKIPVIGALLEFNQSVMVNRKNPESRKQAIAQIIERLTSNGYWPQMLMFPEGTTTNGTILIKFKRGAFLAGVPVQPVLLHYPNKLDTVRWTHKGTTWIETLWHTCSQLYTNVTIEYLPVYTPSQEEKDDPNLYADNVQKLMAKTLGIPATDHVMEGRVPTRMLGGLSLPLEPPARETLSLLHKDGLGESEVEVALTQMIDRCQSEQGWGAVVDELVPLMGLTDRQTAAKICGLYSKDDKVDLRQIYLSVAAVSSFMDFKSLLHIAFTLYDREGSGSLTAVDVSDLMGAVVGSPQYHTEELYSELSRRGVPTEQELFRVLTTHPTYQKLISEYLTSEGAESTMPSTPLINGKVGNNNEGLPNDNRSALLHKTADNSSALPHKKDD
uniref:lysophospholipid acyltransferase LPCAT4-like n=1 Tax=Oncorhynchus gorbuscha TaxID=8017 RepID=UPI001EAED6DD|nr:lysophospholipid acyltransferase LPCAT4-like [Oncorhynchus gorbuscha]